jgi:chorismate synthase
MASNSFGQHFRITTFGESHGPGIGVVIDGCPPGLLITQEEIEQELALRRPGHSHLTSPRKEDDAVQILSGFYNQVSTGAPIALWIENRGADSTPYLATQHLYKPGHAHYTYLAKYGIWDPRGGSRASARETAARVAAGAIAKKWIAQLDLDCVAYLSAVGPIQVPPLPIPPLSLQDLKQRVRQSPLFVPDPTSELLIKECIETVRQEQDSIGGVVSVFARVPVGLGEPIYQKLEACLAFAMLSIPASKGFSIGKGFIAATMKGSEHNDSLTLDSAGRVVFTTNHAGGTLGGISTGELLYFQVPFKPTSSIQQPQPTLSIQHRPDIFRLPPGSKHDPCVAIRAVPVVEAMCALVLADLILANKLTCVPSEP